MAYAYAGEGPLDYHPCRYGGSKLLFRGPQRDLSLPYVAALGGAETYGRFVARPWPDLVEAETGWRMVNLGCANAGPEAWLADPETLRVARGARAVVVQLPGAANQSNGFYTVHPRRNDRFLRAQPPLRRLFPEVDFTGFNFTGHLLGTLHMVSPPRFDEVAAELRAAWLARLRALVRALAPVPVVLVWIGRAPPPERGGLATADPVLVDAAMVAAAARVAAALVTVVFSAAARAAGIEGMAFAPLERPAAEALPGPLGHAEIAAALAPVLDGLP